jgi:hypothetical protein
MSPARSGICFEFSEGDLKMKIKAYFYMLYYDLIAWRNKVDKWSNLRKQSKEVLKYMHPDSEINLTFWLIVLACIAMLIFYFIEFFVGLYLQVT